MRPGLKLEIFHYIIEGKHITPLLDGLTIEEALVLQKYLWEKTVEIGLKVKGKYFSREEVTSKMLAVSAYQKEQGCRESESACKGFDCIQVNPDCAVKRIKGQIDVMAGAIHKYFQLAARNIQETVESY